jgi:hypothetical protein
VVGAMPPHGGMTGCKAIGMGSTIRPAMHTCVYGQSSQLGKEELSSTGGWGQQKHGGCEGLPRQGRAKCDDWLHCGNHSTQPVQM